jgi:hypothetical protein
MLLNKITVKCIIVGLYYHDANYPTGVFLTQIRYDYSKMKQALPDFAFNAAPDRKFINFQ